VKNVAEQVRTRFEWDDGTWHEDGVRLVDGELPPTLVDFHQSCSGNVPSMTMWELITPTTSGQPRYGLVYDGPCILAMREPEERVDVSPLRVHRFFESGTWALLLLGRLIAR
jgi:hypothetical protein